MSVHEQTLAVPLSLHGIFVTFVYLLPLLEDRDCVFFMSVFPVLDRCFSTQKKKIAFIVLLWMIVKLCAEIREKNLHIFEKNISSFCEFFHISILM